MKDPIKDAAAQVVGDWFGSLPKAIVEMFDSAEGIRALIRLYDLIISALRRVAGGGA